MPHTAPPTLLLTVLAVSTVVVAAEPVPHPSPPEYCLAERLGVRQLPVADQQPPRVLLIGDSILDGNLYIYL